jgi:hypothetical protein
MYVKGTTITDIIKQLTNYGESETQKIGQKRVNIIAKPKKIILRNNRI